MNDEIKLKQSEVKKDKKRHAEQKPISDYLIKRSRDPVDIGIGTIIEKTHKHAQGMINSCNCFFTITLTFSDQHGRESNVSINFITNTTSTASTSGGDGEKFEQIGN